MKILIYGLNFYPEEVGIGKFTGELAFWLKNKKNKINVVTSVPYFPEWKVNSNNYKKEVIKGINVFRCPIWIPNKLNTFTRVIHLLSFSIFSFPIFLKQLIWEPDLVFCVAPSILCAPSSLIFKIFSKSNTKFWLHIQDLELEAAYKMGFLKVFFFKKIIDSFEGFLYKRFDKVSSISRAMINNISKKISKNETEVFYFPNWIEMNNSSQVCINKSNRYLEELNIPSKSKIILYSGSMNQKQGIEILIEVFEYLKDIPDLYMIIAGDGFSKKLILRMSKNHERIINLPLQPKNRLNDFLRLADVHLLPQKKEIADYVMPSKLLGIMASSRPVVVSSPKNSDLGKIAEKVGIRVDPDDSINFAKAVRLLLKDQNLRQVKGMEAFKFVRENFYKETVLKSFLEEARKI